MDNEIIELASRYIEAALLHFAVASGLLEETKTFITVEDLADRLNVLPHKLRTCLDGLISMGLLEYQSGQVKNRSITNQHLIQGAEDDLRAFVLHMKEQWQYWHELESILKTYEPFPWQQDYSVFTRPEAHRLLLESTAQEAGDMPTIISALPEWRVCRDFIDVGGGHGRYAASIARRYPNIHGKIWDTELSFDVAQKTLDDAGVANRITFESCDIRAAETWNCEPTDGILIANVLPNFSEREIRTLLFRAVQVLRPGGVIVVLNPWINEACTAPLSSAIFAVMIMIACQNGWVPPEKIIIDAMELAGLDDVRVEKLKEDESLWIGIRRT